MKQFNTTDPLPAQAGLCLQYYKYAINVKENQAHTENGCKPIRCKWAKCAAMLEDVKKLSTW